MTKYSFKIPNIPDSVLEIMEIINTKYESRLVGGCVRDAFISEVPKDWDISTTGTPEEIIEILEKSNITVVPTGLDYGTVTAFINKIGYEITSCRLDVSTDGRRACVEYCTSFEKDSLRRDFTMNALYFDPITNVLYDYHDGVKHLQSKELNFVGNGEERIKEDYLRVLRGFRFSLKYLLSPPKELSRECPAWISKGICTLSGERIWQELSKILLLHGSVQHSMAGFGLLYANKYITEVLSIPALPKPSAESPQIIYTINVNLLGSVSYTLPEVVLAKMFVLWSIDKTNFEETKAYKSLSVVERNNFQNSYRILKNINTEIEIGNITDVEDVMDISILSLLYERNINKLSDELLSEIYGDDMEALIELQEAQKFPVTGADLLTLGWKQGKEMGQVLKKLENTWVISGYKFDKQQLLDTLTVE